MSRSALYAQRDTNIDTYQHVDVYADIYRHAHLYCYGDAYQYIHPDDDPESDADQNCHAYSNTQPHPNMDSV